MFVLKTKCADDKLMVSAIGFVINICYIYGKYLSIALNVMEGGFVT